MLYGESCDLAQDFFEKCAFYKIPVVIHRRNMPRAVIITPTLPPDQENLLTKQIFFRQNEKKEILYSQKTNSGKIQINELANTSQS